MSERRILITGASDGIGKALALELAKRGYHLALTARRIDKLTELKLDIEQRFPQIKVEVAAMDVGELACVEPTIRGLSKALGGLDIVMANAGIAYAGKFGESPLEKHIEVIHTNVSGAMATLDAALKLFREQGYGHLVGTSSVAAYRGFPRNAAYCASKAALSTFMEALRAETHKENIDITVLHPGYIDTEINRAVPSRPFLIYVDKGASVIADLIEKKVARSTVPVFPWNLVAPILKQLPTAIVARL